ncbi:MAG: hypothetical protein VX519_01920 [Myxococcota bacterium]|nr:hypothetical protein [Myxococcota bacterium]
MKSLLPCFVALLFGCVPEVEKLADPDTGDTQQDTAVEACGVEDLVYGAEAREGGFPCEVCPRGVLLSLVGTITNVCDEPVRLFTGGGKIVRSFSLEPLGLDGAEPLVDTEIEWLLGPLEVLDEEIVEMTLPDDDYLLSVEFSDLPDRHEVTHVFQVRAR